MVDKDFALKIIFLIMIFVLFMVASSFFSIFNKRLFVVFFFFFYAAYFSDRVKKLLDKHYKSLLVVLAVSPVLVFFFSGGLGEGIPSAVDMPYQFYLFTYFDKLVEVYHSVFGWDFNFASGYLQLQNQPPLLHSLFYVFRKLFFFVPDAFAFRVMVISVFLFPTLTLTYFLRKRSKKVVIGSVFVWLSLPHNNLMIGNLLLYFSVGWLFLALDRLKKFIDGRGKKTFYELAVLTVILFYSHPGPGFLFLLISLLFLPKFKSVGWNRFLITFLLIVGSCSLFAGFVFLNNQGTSDSFVFGSRGYDYRVEFYQEYFRTSPLLFLLPLGVVLLSKGFFRKVTAIIYLFLISSLIQSFIVFPDSLSFITIIADKGLFASTSVFSFLSIYSLKLMHDKLEDKKSAEMFLFFITFMFLYLTLVRVSFVTMTCFEPMVFWEQLYRWNIYYETNKVVDKIWDYSFRSDTLSVLKFLNNSNTDSRVLWEDSPQFPLGGGHVMSLAWMETNKSFANKPYALTFIKGVDLRNEYPEVLGVDVREDYALFLERLREYNVKHVVAYQDFSEFLESRPEFKKVHSAYYEYNRSFPYTMFFKNNAWHVAESIPDDSSLPTIPGDDSKSYKCNYTNKHFFNLRNEEREGIKLIPCGGYGDRKPVSVGQEVLLSKNHSYTLKIGFLQMFNHSDCPVSDSVVKVWLINQSGPVKLMEKVLKYSGEWEDYSLNLTPNVNSNGYYELRVEEWPGGEYVCDDIISTNFVVLDEGPREHGYEEPVVVAPPTVNVYEFVDSPNSYVIPPGAGSAWVEGKAIRARINSTGEDVLLSYSHSNNFVVNDSSVSIRPNKDDFIALSFKEPGFYDLRIEFFPNPWGRLAEAVSAICFLILLLFLFKSR